MHEIELKFQVDAAHRDRVAAAVATDVAGAAPARRVRLQAAYFDTADRALARARIALRVRREGRRWVQTLKGAADDGMTRFEHNVDLAAPGSGSVGDTPVVDPLLHAGTEVGDRLATLLGAAGGDLVCLYRTDVWRRTRQVRTRQGTVELAFDEGRIVAGDAVLALCELEFELVAGSPLAVIETARRWARRHGLAFDTRSKSERGDMLARGVRLAPPRHAGPVRLDAAMTPAEAERAVMRSCLDQIAPNASQVASGEFDDEHLHQLRVGLRRLRTALRFFEADPASPLAAQAAALFHALGAARDSSALAPIEAAVGAAMAAAGVALTAPSLADDAAMVDAAAIVRGGPAQSLLLDLLVAAQGSGDSAPPAEPGPALRTVMVDRLKRMHRQLIDDISAFDTLGDAGRHRLRRRAKRLRYATEFSAALFGRRRVARYLKALRRMQVRLGALTDGITALAHVRERAATDPAGAFAAGWLTARHEALVTDCRPALDAFVRVDRVWRRR